MDSDEWSSVPMLWPFFHAVDLQVFVFIVESAEQLLVIQEPDRE